MDTNILLESGTNELEILEFTVGPNRYGINVAKIREILQYTPAVPIPNADPAIEGIFMPRDEVVTSISLSKVLHLPESADTKNDLYIVTYFNNINAAFHVHSVVGITRVSWEEVLKPDSTLNGHGEGVSTGIVKLDGRLIVLLDFEKIIADISPETSIQAADVDELGFRARSAKPILIAEDSALLSKLIQDCLKKAGYVNLIVNTDGQEAWEKVDKMASEGNITDKVKLIITDIEMPRMDGHRFTKLVKSDERTKMIPVIIFSSMISVDMIAKGQSLGADAQITKPEINKLVGEIDRLILD
ncbi:MAG: chemotaxis protein CheV [Lachnospiraceae bacterium]|nr:chemotaxis protein CheV [Lachnospiraceae bacterium]MBP5248912.1 chemotaxis protein CheV [Lachnospiraceae bacterium]